MDNCYDDLHVTTIRWIYAIFIVIWIITILVFSIYRLSYPIILLIPIILFIIAFVNAPKLSEDVESEMSKIIYFSMIVIIAVCILARTNKDKLSNAGLISACVIIAMVFLLASSFDIWVSKCWIFAYRHIQSAFETMAVSLIIYAVIAYGVSFKFS